MKYSFFALVLLFSAPVFAGGELKFEYVPPMASCFSNNYLEKKLIISDNDKCFGEIIWPYDGDKEVMFLHLIDDNNDDNSKVIESIMNFMHEKGITEIMYENQS